MRPNTQIYRLPILIFLGFGLQNLFLKLQYLFFQHAMQMNLLFPIGIGLALGSFLANKNKKVRNEILILTLSLFALSSLITINFYLFSAFVFLIYMTLGQEIACEMNRVTGKTLIHSDILGSLLGSLIGFFLPLYIGIESAFFLFLSLASIISRGNLLRILSLLFFGISLILGIYRDFDLTKYGATFDNPITSDGNPPKNGAQYATRILNAKRVLNEWSSLGKIEFIESCSEKKEIFAFSNNRKWFKIHNDDEFEKIDSSNAKKALVIGAGGGAEVTLLLGLGSHVTALEINEIAYQTLSNIVSRKGLHSSLKVLQKEGRNYIRNTKDRFDYIFITNLGTNGVTFGERDMTLHSYLLTNEAFHSYFDRLNPGGLIVANSRFDRKEPEYSQGIPILNTIFQTLQNRGLEAKAHLRIATLATPYPAIKESGTIRTLFFISNQPFKVRHNDVIEQTKKLNFHPTKTQEIFGVYASSNADDELNEIKKIISEIFSNQRSNIRSINQHFITDNRPYISSPQGTIYKIFNILSVMILIGLFLFLICKSRFRISLHSYSFVYVSCFGIGGAIAEVTFLNMISLHLLNISKSFLITTSAFAFGSSIAYLLSISLKRISILYSSLVVGFFLCFLSATFEKAVFLISYDNQFKNFIGIFASITIVSLFLFLPFSLLFLKIKERSSSSFLPLWSFYMLSFACGTQFGIISFYNFGLKETLFLSGIVILLASIFARGTEAKLLDI